MRRMLVALILVTALFPITAMSETHENGGIVIEEILVSASSAQYNGTDWNGDGDFADPMEGFQDADSSQYAGYFASCCLHFHPGLRA